MKKPDSTPCTLFLLLMSAILMVSSCNKEEKEGVQTDAKEETPFTKETKDLVKSDSSAKDTSSMVK